MKLIKLLFCPIFLVLEEALFSLNLPPKSSSTPFKASRILKGKAFPLYDYFSKGPLKGNSKTPSVPKASPSDFYLSLQYETCTLPNSKSSVYFPFGDTMTSGKVILSPPPPGSVTKGQCPPNSSKTAQVFLLDPNPQNFYSLNLFSSSSKVPTINNGIILQNNTLNDFMVNSIKISPLEKIEKGKFSTASSTPLFKAFLENLFSQKKDVVNKKQLQSAFLNFIQEKTATKKEASPSLVEKFPGQGEEDLPLTEEELKNLERFLTFVAAEEQKFAGVRATDPPLDVSSLEIAKALQEFERVTSDVETVRQEKAKAMYNYQEELETRFAELVTSGKTQSEALSDILQIQTIPPETLQAFVQYKKAILDTEEGKGAALLVDLVKSVG